jgi:hypothetical protein
MSSAIGTGLTISVVSSDSGGLAREPPQLFAPSRSIVRFAVAAGPSCNAEIKPAVDLYNQQLFA